jgi:hypothetical protein
VAGHPKRPGATLGTPDAARFRDPGGMAQVQLQDGTDAVLVADRGNHRVVALYFRCDESNAQFVCTSVSVLAGTHSHGYVDGVATLAEFKQPRDLCVCSDGSLAISDYQGNRIRQLMLQDNKAMTLEYRELTAGLNVAAEELRRLVVGHEAPLLRARSLVKSCGQMSYSLQLTLRRKAFLPEARHLLEACKTGCAYQEAIVAVNIVLHHMCIAYTVHTVISAS